MENQELKKNESAIQITDAQPADIPGIIQVERDTWLATYVNEEYGVTREDILAKDFMNPKRIVRWTKFLADPNTKMLVAKNETGKPVGFCIVKIGRKRNTLSALYLLPDYQRKGVGKQLTEQALAWLGTEKDIQLDVVTYNIQAQRAYEKYGFELEGETPHEDISKLPSGKPLPELRMIKRAKK